MGVSVISGLNILHFHLAWQVTMDMLLLGNERKKQVQPMAFLSISIWYPGAKCCLHFNIIPYQLLHGHRWQWSVCVCVCVCVGFLEKWNAVKYKDGHSLLPLLLLCLKPSFPPHTSRKSYQFFPDSKERIDDPSHQGIEFLMGNIFSLTLQKKKVCVCVNHVKKVSLYVITLITKYQIMFIKL